MKVATYPFHTHLLFLAYNMESFKSFASQVISNFK